MSDEIKLSDNAKKIMDLVEKLNVLELNDLVKALEEKFGVTASAPVMMGAMMPAAGAATNGEASAEEEKSEFDVVLTSSGDAKVNVIKAVRQINPALGLVEAKNLVDSAPKTILEGAKKEAAQEAKKVLEAAGAKVELK